MWKPLQPPHILLSCAQCVFPQSDIQQLRGYLGDLRDSNMASPRDSGCSAQDITHVMQKLQGRCKMLTHTSPPWLAAFLEVTWHNEWLLIMCRMRCFTFKFYLNCNSSSSKCGTWRTQLSLIYQIHHEWQTLYPLCSVLLCCALFLALLFS